MAHCSQPSQQGQTARPVGSSTTIDGHAWNQHLPLILNASHIQVSRASRILELSPVSYTQAEATCAFFIWRKTLPPSRWRLQPEQHQQVASRNTNPSGKQLNTETQRLGLEELELIARRHSWWRWGGMLRFQSRHHTKSILFKSLSARLTLHTNQCRARSGKLIQRYSLPCNLPVTDVTSRLWDPPSFNEAQSRCGCACLLYSS